MKIADLSDRDLELWMAIATVHPDADDRAYAEAHEELADRAGMAAVELSDRIDDLARALEDGDY